MSAPTIESIASVMCPACQRYTYFTDNYDDFEAHHAHFEKSEVEWQPGVDVGAWRPIVDIRINGRDVQLTRKDLAVFRVYPILCLGCNKRFVAHLTVTNLTAVRHYEEVTRKLRPPDAASPAIQPKWGMRGFSVSEFVTEVRGIKNRMVRAAVARRMMAVMDVRNAQQQSEWAVIISTAGAPVPTSPDE